YRVVVTYANDVPDRSQIEDDNPLNSPAVVRWEDGEMEISINRDLDGKPILLPTKRAFNPAITMLVPTGRLVVERNERQRDPDPDGKYRLRVNANTFYGKPAGTMLLKTISHEQLGKNGIRYFRQVYTWEWNIRGWNEPVLIQDTYHVD